MPPAPVWWPFLQGGWLFGLQVSQAQQHGTLGISRLVHNQIIGTEQFQTAHFLLSESGVPETEARGRLKSPKRKMTSRSPGAQVRHRRKKWTPQQNKEAGNRKLPEVSN